MRLLTLVVALVAISAFADEEECGVSDGDIRAQFSAKPPAGFKLVSSKKEKRHLTEVLKTPEGYEVTLELGGCSHLAYSFGIKGGAITPKTVGSELVAVSRRVLPTLPMRKDAIADPKLLLKAIEETNIAIVPTDLSCGDATCRLSLETVEEKEPPRKPAKKPKKGAKPEEPKPPAGVLKLSYDFAL